MNVKLAATVVVLMLFVACPANAQSLRELLETARSGDVESQFRLGYVFATGDGGPINYGESVYWYSRAASQGDATSMYNLGLLYVQGLGVEQDYRQGAQLFRSAAEDGLPLAQYSLALAYLNGDGVQVDYVQAYHWSNLASTLAPRFDDSELEKASRELRDFLEVRMSQIQIAEAQALTTAWIESTPNGVANPFRRSGASRSVSYDPTIASIQEGLDLLGYYDGSIDGIRGSQTNAAIRNFAIDYDIDTAVLTPSDLALRVGAAIGMAAGGSAGDGAHEETGGTPVHATGSGFIVSTTGHLVTNAHVVEDCSAIRTVGHGTTRVLAVEPASDLALLKLDDYEGNTVTLRQGRGIRLGENVVVIGYPLSGVLSSGPNVTSGNVSSLAGPGDDRRLIQISAPIQAGNSGGPVLDDAGNLVGVVVSKLDAIAIVAQTGDLPQNVNFAIGLGTVQAFLDGHSVAYELATSDRSRSTSDIAETARGYTLMLECLN